MTAVSEIPIYRFQNVFVEMECSLLKLMPHQIVYFLNKEIFYYHAFSNIYFSQSAKNIRIIAIAFVLKHK